MHNMPWYKIGPDGHDWPKADPPVGATPIGNPDRQPFVVYLGSKAMDTIESQLNDHHGTGIRGLLVGQPYSSGTQQFITVTDCIVSNESLSGENDDTLFSSDDLERMRLVWERDAPHSVVVGWFDASANRDEKITVLEQFMHQRLFSLPWQVALIINPTRQTSQLYYLQGEHLTASEGFYYYDATLVPILHTEVSTTIAPVTNMGAPSRRGQRNRRSFFPYVFFLLLLVYFFIPGAPGGFLTFNKSIAKQRDQLSALRQQLDQLKTDNETLDYLTAERKNLVHEMFVGRDASDHMLSGGNTSPASDEINFGGGTRVGIDAGSAPPLTGKEQYVIQPGDTMWHISKRLVGDPKAYLGLAESNDIENPDLIFPGQTIKKPE